MEKNERQEAEYFDVIRRYCPILGENVAMKRIACEGSARIECLRACTGECKLKRHARGGNGTQGPPTKKDV